MTEFEKHCEKAQELIKQGRAEEAQVLVDAAIIEMQLSWIEHDLQTEELMSIL